MSGCQKPQKFTVYKTTTMLCCVVPLSSRSQSCAASPSIVKKHFSEGLFTRINPDQSKTRPSESSFRAERSAGCSLNLSSSSRCPQPPLCANEEMEQGDFSLPAANQPLPLCGAVSSNQIKAGQRPQMVPQRKSRRKLEYLWPTPALLRCVSSYLYS